MTDPEGRGKRRCVQKKTKAPSAVHYVGYVEDDETPEMIMKKFEELARVLEASKGKKDQPDGQGDEDLQAAACQPDPNSEELDQGLGEEDLLEVFKQTSIFSVKSALANNEALVAENAFSDEEGWSGDELLSDVEDDRGFWSDEDAVEPAGKRQNRAKGEGIPREKHVRQRKQHAIVTQYSLEANAFIQKRVRVLDDDAIVQIRIPEYPIPLSWGRQVKPYQGKVDHQQVTDTSSEAIYYEAAEVAKFDYKALNRTYQAVLVDTVWEGPQDDDEVLTRQLSQIPMTTLCPVGFVLVWAKKERAESVMRVMFDWDYVYVENLTWVMIHPNNRILTVQHQHASLSHLTLYMFKKGDHLAIMHQRNPDVHFDTVKIAPGGGWDIPEEVLITIETLLPEGRGAYLHLWSPPNVRRPGWTHVSQIPQAAAG